MTRYRYVLLFILCMILFPNISKAECSYERQAELSRIASNVQFSYSYEMVNGMPVFTINVTNLTHDIYVYDNKREQIISGDEEVNILYKDDNASFGFDIYSADDSCYGEKIITKYIQIPKYNVYSSSDECLANPDFKYCAMWLNTSVTLKQFNKELKEYQASKVSDTVESNNDGILDVILQYKNELIICLCTAIFLFSIIFIRKYRR